MKNKIEIETKRFESKDGTKKFDVAFDGLAYTNATEQYLMYDKTSDGFNYYKKTTLVPYAEKLIELGKIANLKNSSLSDNQVITVDDLIVVRRGGKQSNHEAGTWLHPKLAIEFGRWLSLEFGIWCNEVIEDLLTFGMVTLQPEDKKWVIFADGLADREPGSAKQMSDAREMLLIHEAQGYNIKSFDDVINNLMKFTAKVDQPKVFEKLRTLIKDMYEAGELGRTSHEEMLERCTATVITVLKKEVKRKNRIISKFEIGTPAPAVDTTPTITEKSIQQKFDNDKALRDSHLVIDLDSIALHKMFGLSNIKPVDLPMYEFGRKRPVCEAKALMDEAGLKVSYMHTMVDWRFRLDRKPNSPHYYYVDSTTNVGVSIWDKGYPNKLSCSVWKSKGTRWFYTYDDLLNITLEAATSSDPNSDPSFYMGVNKEGTIGVTFSAITLTIMVFGFEAKK
jgi:hypothetical protein